MLSEMWLPDVNTIKIIVNLDNKLKDESRHISVILIVYIYLPIYNKYITYIIYFRPLRV